jgi:hypothetical protein
MANAKSSDASIEYSLFTQAKGEGWQPQGMTNEMEKALASADKLLESGKYEKVEIKQKYFDKKANRLVEGTLKTLTYTKPSQLLPIIGLLILAVAAGGGSFAAAYFLTRDAAPAAAAAESSPAEKPAH